MAPGLPTAVAEVRLRCRCQNSQVSSWESHRELAADRGVGGTRSPSISPSKILTGHAHGGDDEPGVGPRALTAGQAAARQGRVLRCADHLLFWLHDCRCCGDRQHNRSLVTVDADAQDGPTILARAPPSPAWSRSRSPSGAWTQSLSTITSELSRSASRFFEVGSTEEATNWTAKRNRWELRLSFGLSPSCWLHCCWPQPQRGKQVDLLQRALSHLLAARGFLT